MDNKRIHELVDLAVDAAVSTGHILFEQGGSTVDLEQGHDIKLRADKESEQRILDVLTPTGITILSEECGLLPKEDSTCYWIVDPLDGSLNYFRGLPMCCVSIALWKGQTEPIFGVIYDFNHDKLYKGIVGEGAWMNDVPIAVSEINEKIRAVVATGFPVYLKCDKSILDEFIQTIQDYKKIRLIGSAALSCAFVAQGAVDAYTEKNIAWWDVAAGVAIIKAAGGKADIEITDRERHLMNVFASNGLIEK